MSVRVFQLEVIEFSSRKIPRENASDPRMRLISHFFAEGADEEFE
jgi:hypothetical protein